MLGSALSHTSEITLCGLKFPKESANQCHGRLPVTSIHKFPIAVSEVGHQSTYHQKLPHTSLHAEASKRQAVKQVPLQVKCLHVETTLTQTPASVFRHFLTFSFAQATGTPTRDVRSCASPIRMHRINLTSRELPGDPSNAERNGSPLLRSMCRRGYK